MSAPPRPTTGPGHCTRCTRAVLWTVTAANRVPMAGDPRPDPGGNVAVYQDATGRYFQMTLGADFPINKGPEPPTDMINWGLGIAAGNVSESDRIGGFIEQARLGFAEAERPAFSAALDLSH